MTKRHFAISLLLAAMLIPLSGCETYPRHGYPDSRDRDYRAPYSRDQHVDVRIVFSDQDRAYISDYYRPRHPHGYPPGLAKKGKVPPGHAKKLRRGEPIPPDYRWQPIPRDLDGRLSRLPEGYVRVVIGADIGIMNVRTHVLVDLLEDLAD